MRKKNIYIYIYIYIYIQSFKSDEKHENLQISMNIIKNQWTPMKIEDLGLEGLRTCGGLCLWQPVAASGALLVFPTYWVLRFWRRPALLHDECKIGGRQGLGGCWMMSERLIGRRSNTLEFEELCGFSLLNISSSFRYSILAQGFPILPWLHQHCRCFTFQYDPPAP